jgi:hypothetical protein
MIEKKSKYHLLRSESKNSYTLVSGDSISGPGIPEDAKVVWSLESASPIEARSAVDIHFGRVPYSEVSKEVARLKQEGAKPSEIVNRLQAKYGQLHIVDLADHLADVYKVERIPTLQLLDCLLVPGYSKITEDEFDAKILHLPETPE